MKTEEKIVGLAIVLLVAASAPTWYWYRYFSGLFTPTVDLFELRLELVTDKGEYYVNETIEASVFVYNDEPHPVKFESIQGSGYSILGYSKSHPEVKVVSIVCGALASRYTVLQANSKMRIAFGRFTPKYPGEFSINVMGRTTTVYVQEPSDQ